MQINTQKLDGILILTVAGRLDARNSGEFEQQALALATTETKIILECQQLEYVSSSGLRVFLLLLKKLKQSNGQLAICGLSPVIREIFDISGFSGIFSIFTDVAQAKAQGFPV